MSAGKKVGEKQVRKGQNGSGKDLDLPRNGIQNLLPGANGYLQSCSPEELKEFLQLKPELQAQKIRQNCATVAFQLSSLLVRRTKKIHWSNVNQLKHVKDIIYDNYKLAFDKVDTAGELPVPIVIQQALVKAYHISTVKPIPEKEVKAVEKTKQ